MEETSRIVLDQLYERKSVRKFTDEEIPEEVRQAILQAAVMAPSAGCQQLYTILEIKDSELKERLAETCDHQPFIASAKWVLIFLADCKKWHDGFESTGCMPRSPGAGDLLLAVADAVIAAQNAVVAAHAFGLGSCYIGDILENAEIHRELLHLPEYVVPAAMLVFGYPTEDQMVRQKPARGELKYIVHENQYHELSEPELEALFSANKGHLPYAEYMQRFCKRKYNSDFAREMTRSANIYLGDFE